MGNVIAFKTIDAFTIDCKKWFYEGEIVKIQTITGEKYNNCLIESILSAEAMLIIADNEGQHYIDIENIEEIEIIERRKSESD